MSLKTGMSLKHSLRFLWTHCKINIWQHHETITIGMFYFVAFVIHYFVPEKRLETSNTTHLHCSVSSLSRLRLGFPDKWSLKIRFITGQLSPFPATFWDFQFSPLSVSDKTRWKNVVIARQETHCTALVLRVLSVLTIVFFVEPVSLSSSLKVP